MQTSFYCSVPELDSFSPSLSSVNNKCGSAYLVTTKSLHSYCVQCSSSHHRGDTGVSEASLPISVNYTLNAKCKDEKN